MLDLRSKTDPSWLDCVLANFGEFLIDHASCERKASATGLAFVSRYPDRPLLVREMLAFAREELDHFHGVYLLLEKRGLLLQSDQKDEYVGNLRALCRKGGEAGLVDSLLVAGIVEARSCERLMMVADVLPAESEEKSFYMDLARAEARHHGLFFRLARATVEGRLGGPDSSGMALLDGSEDATTTTGHRVVQARAGELLEAEARIVARLPITPRVH